MKLTRIQYCPSCGNIYTADENQPGGLDFNKKCDHCQHILVLAPKPYKEFKFQEREDGSYKSIGDDEAKKWIREEYFFADSNTEFNQEAYNNRIRFLWNKVGKREERPTHDTPLEEYYAIREKELKKRNPQVVYGGQASCPRCGSTSISTQKKGFGLGKAVAGVFAIGTAGALAGAAGANKVYNICQKCGHKWTPGK